MKIKRYLDKDMRLVLRRVRKEQGPDAVILSNRRVDAGIEVIAAIDYDDALIRRAIGLDAGDENVGDKKIGRDELLAIAENDGTPPAAEITAATVEPRPAPGSGSGNFGRGLRDTAGPTLGKLQQELTSLRGLLETQLSGLIWKDGVERSPMRAQMLRNLARLGIAPDVAGMIIDRLEPVADVKSLWHAPLMALARCLPVRQSGLLEHGGTFALIGPTGVGKTTTIAKLAAQYAIRNGTDGIALISADSFRIGAKEHLAAFANIIGTKVYSAASSEDLNDLLTRLCSKSLVLIDTEGRSPRDRELAQRLAAYGSNRQRVRFFLTLSAATQETALDEAILRFRKVPLEGCIVTKIDESGQLGHVISAMIRHDLAACWLADGQRIPEDLHAASHKKLWLINQAVECLERAQPNIDERVMADNYSAKASSVNA